LEKIIPIEPEDDILERARSSKFFYVFYVICKHKIFEGFIIFLILGNTLSLALDREPIDKDTFRALEIANTIFSWLFFGEMIIKLIGLGFKGYARDRFNLFDCVIVMFSTIEMVMELA
jgi:voltage-gated sodium channel